MKILCNQTTLTRGVQAVQRAISTKNTLPLLGGILIETKDNQLLLTATDLDLGIKTHVSCKVVTPGKTVVPGKLFPDMVRLLPQNTEISIQQEENVLHLIYGQSEIKLNCYDPNLFPNVMISETQATISFDPALIKEIFEQVLISVSRDTTRPEFTGVFFRMDDNSILDLVSTDTHRLTLIKQKINYEGSFPSEGFIVPGRALLEVTRLLKNEDEYFYLKTINNQIVFQMPHSTVISRLIDANFPYYREVIPDDQETVFYTQVHDFQESLERAALLAREETKLKANIIKLKITENNLNIESKSPEIGYVNENIKIIKEGVDNEVAFNVRYLIDALKVMRTEKTRIAISSSTKAAIISPDGDRDFLCLILPVRLV